MGWVTVDAADADPIRFLNYMALAIERALRSRKPIVERIGGTAGSALSNVVPRLTSALHELGRPMVLMLDDVHHLGGTPSADVLAMVIDYLPRGITIAAAGRTDAGLPLARLRASGRLVEIGIGDLALDEAEAGRMAALGGRQLPPDEARDLHATDGGLARRGLPGGAPRAGRCGGERPVGGTHGRVGSGHGHRRLPRRGAARPRDAAGARVPDPHRGPRPDERRAVRRGGRRLGLGADPARPRGDQPAGRPPRRAGRLVPVPHAAARAPPGDARARPGLRGRAQPTGRGVVRGQRHARDGRRPPVRRQGSRRRRRAGLPHRPAAVPRGPRGDVRALARPARRRRPPPPAVPRRDGRVDVHDPGRRRRGGADDRPHDRFGVPRRAPDRRRGVRGGAGVGPRVVRARRAGRGARGRPRGRRMRPRVSARGGRSRSRCSARSS